MSSTLPVISGREVVRVFESLGWEAVRQTGSHIIMVKNEEPATLSIPDLTKHKTNLCPNLCNTIDLLDSLRTSRFVAASREGDKFTTINPPNSKHQKRADILPTLQTLERPKLFA